MPVQPHLTAKAPTVTPKQAEVLAQLARYTWAVNPCSFGGPAAAAIARRLASQGLVRLDRISDLHIRYAITDAGRAAQPQPDYERLIMVGG
jgi:hypothetical protein